MKRLLSERFQQLAGIKPLYEIGEPSKIMAAGFPSHEMYKDLYIGDDQEFRDMGFEYIEAFTVAPYVFIEWNDTGIISYRYDSEEEFISNFSEMGHGEYDVRECSIIEITKVINDSQPQSDSMYGLALLTNGEVTAMGGENPSTIKPQDPQDDSSIAGMEDDEEEEYDKGWYKHEGSCGYTTDTDGNELPTPGGTNRKGITAFNQSKRMK